MSTQSQQELHILSLLCRHVRISVPRVKSTDAGLPTPKGMVFQSAPYSMWTRNYFTQEVALCDLFLNIEKLEATLRLVFTQFNFWKIFQGNLGDMGVWIFILCLILELNQNQTFSFPKPWCRLPSLAPGFREPQKENKPSRTNSDNLIRGHDIVKCEFVKC